MLKDKSDLIKMQFWIMVLGFQSRIDRLWTPFEVLPRFSSSRHGQHYLEGTLVPVAASRSTYSFDFQNNPTGDSY